MTKPTQDPFGEWISDKEWWGDPVTKPTQAQIEAAAKAMYGLDGPVEGWAEESVPTRNVYLRSATAALTAAADNQHSKMFDYISGKATGRVAQLEAQLEHMMAYCVAASDVDMAVAATIERCAQVAESRKRTEPSVIINSACDEIAAAIRALKDKPTLDPNIIHPGKDLTNVFPEEEP